MLSCHKAGRNCFSPRLPGYVKRHVGWGCLPEKWLRSLPQTWNLLQSIGSGKKPGCRQRKEPALSDPTQGSVLAGCVEQEALLQLMSESTSEQLMLVRAVKPRSPRLAQTTSLSQPSQYGPEVLHPLCTSARVTLPPSGCGTDTHCIHTLLELNKRWSCLPVHVTTSRGNSRKRGSRDVCLLHENSRQSINHSNNMLVACVQWHSSGVLV